MPTLAELKELIKKHKDGKPKMSAGKEALLLYAEKAGLLKPKEEIKVERELPAKKLVKMVKGLDDEYPELKKIEKKLPAKAEKKLPAKEVESPAKETAKKTKATVKKEVEMEKPSKGGFAAFISANKGQGHNMKSLAEMYRAQKDE
jgi:translation initiation factor 1 (eIF-1/SUI1)